MQQNNARGFTIPEVIITLGIAAILLTTVVPSVNDTIEENRLATQVNDVIADIHFARSEAAKRNVRVILCKSTQPNAGSPRCSTDLQTAHTWSSGYLIFADNGNATNSTYDAGSDILLRRGQPAPDGVRMYTSSAWTKNLEFNPNGSTNEGGATAKMSICNSRERVQCRQVFVAPNGIPKAYGNDVTNSLATTAQLSAPASRQWNAR